MRVIYVCLTCFRISADDAECHGRRMIGCDASEPKGSSPQLGLHPHAPHWLLKTLRDLKDEQAERPKDQQR